ncbi:MAG: cation transporter [Burkholderiales bacterium]|jgi:cobalt-zinc-cadmium efflux system protein|nr:cation transporter [Burkholderiales bacterium]
MSSTHDHGHAHPQDPHGHDHPMPAHGRAFGIGILLNIGFVIIEAWYGWVTGSLALLADAAHNLSDVGGLLLAWAAFAAARLKPDERHTYGWRRGSILASFANAIILLVAMGSLGWEAIQRFADPSPISAVTVIVVAAIGVVVNAVTAWLFMAGSKSDLNIRGAFLHMAADALVSVGVVIAGLLYLWQGWLWIDPLASLVIAAVVVIGTWSLFRQSLHLLFDGVPEHINLAEVLSALQQVPGVASVHDLHVWAMSTAEQSLTAHLVATGERSNNDMLLAAQQVLRERFGIEHVTLQIEIESCAAACEPRTGSR